MITIRECTRKIPELFDAARRKACLIKTRNCDNNIRYSLDCLRIKMFGLSGVNMNDELDDY